MEKCLNGKYLVLNIVDQLHAGPCAIIILWYIKLRGLLIIIKEGIIVWKSVIFIQENYFSAKKLIYFPYLVLLTSEKENWYYISNLKKN